jgi:putative nucleotidyltransferase with HDIG domain
MEVAAQELLTTGGAAATHQAARAGYLPVPLAHLPSAALAGINVFVRAAGEHNETDRGVYLPYRSADAGFTGVDRETLLGGGIELVFIRIEDHDRFRTQLENEVATIADDPDVAVATKATLVYETGVQLIDDILADPDLGRFSGQVRTLAKSTATIVLKNEDAFSHLFSASHHDFYTATHMVNVATYIVPLAHKMGYTDPAELTLICEAALLHDIGKNFVPQDILNSKNKLTDEEWSTLRDHARIGAEHLAQYDVDELLIRVAGEHHERLNGSGYPYGKKGDEIHPISKICAVVDSFDAMTALRPYKKNVRTPLEALEVLRGEAPDKLWHEAVEAWAELLSMVEPSIEPRETAPLEAEPDHERRMHRRYKLNCKARLNVIFDGAAPADSPPSVDGTAHNISACGLGVLAQTPLEIGTRVRAYIQAKSWEEDFLCATVVRCRRYEDGWIEIGMRLTGRGSRGSEPDPVTCDLNKRK